MEKSKRIIIIIMIMLLFILLCALTVLIIILKQEENLQVNFSNTTENKVDTDTITKNKKTVKSVIESTGSVYIEEIKNEIYVIFYKDLYEKDGKSNEEFFIDLVNDLDEFYLEESFYIIDEEKNIKIFAKRSEEDNSLTLIINDIENFYRNTDGKEYYEVENAKIVEASNLLLENPILEKMRMHNMYFSSIEKVLTEEKELENGYVSYPNEQIKLKLSPNKAIFNIIFLEDYKDKVLYDIDLSKKLKDIAELHQDYVFGSLSDGYLGYRSGEFYYFFYGNQISIYPYSYKKNTDFENILETYLEEKDLNLFVKNLKMMMKSFCELEYDEEIQKLYVSYPSRGIKIDIRDNNPKGITLYSNYCFSDRTKQWVKDGRIQYNKHDYVNEYEQMRKEAE